MGEEPMLTERRFLPTIERRSKQDASICRRSNRSRRILDRMTVSVVRCSVDVNIRRILLQDDSEENVRRDEFRSKLFSSLVADFDQIIVNEFLRETFFERETISSYWSTDLFLFVFACVFFLQFRFQFFGSRKHFGTNDLIES